MRRRSTLVILAWRRLFYKWLVSKRGVRKVFVFASEGGSKGATVVWSSLRLYGGYPPYDIMKMLR